MITCQICDSSAFKYLFSKKGRQYHRCTKCGLIFQHPVPSAEALHEFYEKSYKQGMYADFSAAKALKVATAKQRLKEISKHMPIQGKWLDIGCSTGTFVKLLEENGLDARGIDISDEAVRLAKKEGLPVECKDIFSVDQNQRFDCITAFDVIEHLRDPASFIQAANRLLKIGGTLVITTPNVRSPAGFLMGRWWFFFIPDEHLFLFSPSTIRRLVTNENLEVVNLGKTFKPMTYDYALLQFKEFNPWIGQLMTAASWVLPKWLRSRVLLLSIGEQRLIATRIA